MRIPTGYLTPPLHANQRLHWAAEAKLKKQVRRDAFMLAKWKKLGSRDHITVGLEWAPATVRERDGGENITLTMKCLIDGLVDAGVVPTDTPQYVTRTMPILLPVDKYNPGIWLVVE